MLRSVVYFFAVLVFTFFLASGSLMAADGGYFGLFAPSKEESSKKTTPPAKASPYSGLIAPQKEEPRSRRRAQKPKGYGGLIGGEVEETKPFVNPYAKQREERRKAEKEKALERERVYTEIPNAPVSAAPKTALEAKMSGVIYEFNKKIKETVGTRTFSEDELAFLRKPRKKYKGMYPSEIYARKRSNEVLSKVQSTTDEDGMRGFEARKAADELTKFADSFRASLATPESTFRNMNLPQSYIKEEKEAKRKALAIVNEALEKVKEYY